MIIFGTKVKVFDFGSQIMKNQCGYCKVTNHYNLVSYEKYFHVFWIPLFRISKQLVAECQHCRRVHNFNPPPSIQKQSQFRNSNTKFESKKGLARLWSNPTIKVIGITGALSVFFIGGQFLLNRNEPVKEVHKAKENPAENYLKSDFQKVKKERLYEQDTLASHILDVINIFITGIDTDEVHCLTKINNNKVLVLLYVRDFKGVKASSRRVLVSVVNDFLENEFGQETHEFYIGVQGRWNLLMAQSPNKQDLSGRFADEALLYPFYKSDKFTIPFK